jgi:hAT family C-terminal dimerisation region
MSLLEDGGAKGSYLHMAYDCLLTVPQTSVASESAFSSAVLICSKIRSRLFV